jgi:hypothetical protein
MHMLNPSAVELSVSWRDSGAQNSVSAMNTTPLLQQLSQQSHCVPHSPSRQGYSPTKWTMALPLHLSQSAVYISLLLPLRGKSGQDPFHPPPVLLAYQNPKPTFLQGSIWPKPGAPKTCSWTSLEWITCGFEHGHLPSGETEGHLAALWPGHVSHVQICCRLYCKMYSILSWYFLD